MTSQNLGTASLTLQADGAQLSKDIGKAQKDTAKKVGALGKKLSTTLTPAVAAIGAAVFAATEEMNRGFAVLQTGTGASGEALEGLKDDFRAVRGTVNASTEEIGAAMADLNTRLGLTGEALQQVTRAALESGIDVNKAAQAMDIFGIAADEAVPFMDKLFVTSQKTGIPIEKLTTQMQVFGPVLKNVGFNADETTALLGNMNAAGVDLTRIMPGVNAFTRRAAKEGITDIKGALFDVVENMKGATSQSEALNIATEAFGAEGAQRMVTAVQDGAFSLDEMVGSLKASSGAIMENAEATRTNTEKMQLMRQEISERVATAFQKLPPEMQLVTGGFGTMLGAMGPLLMGVGSLPAMIGMMGKMGTAMKAMNVGLATSPIGIMIIALAALVAAGILIYKNWDTISAKAIEIWDAIQAFIDKTLGTIVGFFKDHWKTILGILFPQVGLAMLVFKNWGKIVGVVKGIFKKVRDTIFGFIDRIIGKIQGLMSKISSIPGAGAIGKGIGALGRIPGLASGGIATMPSLAMVGEAGPEAIVPLDRLGEIMGGIGAGAGGTREISLVLGQHRFEGLLLQSLDSLDRQGRLEIDLS